MRDGDEIYSIQRDDTKHFLVVDERDKPEWLGLEWEDLGFKGSGTTRHVKLVGFSKSSAAKTAAANLYRTDILGKAQKQAYLMIAPCDAVKVVVE